MSDQGIPNEPARGREEPPRGPETPPSRGGGITAVAIVAVVAMVIVALVLMFNVFGGDDSSGDNGGLLEVPAELRTESGGESGSSSY